MRILKPLGEEIIFDDKVRHLLFNINVIDEIQEYYDMYIVDVINMIFESKDRDVMKKSYDVLTYVLKTLLNEDVRLHNKKNPDDQWEALTEDFIKDEILTNETSMQIGLLVLNAFSGSLPKSKGDNNPNQMSGQTKK
jgi:hypothetical protein